MYEWNDHQEIFSPPQAIENFRQYLRLRTDILQKTVVGAPDLFKRSSCYFNTCAEIQAWQTPVCVLLKFIRDISFQFHGMLEGDLEFKLKPGLTNNDDQSTMHLKSLFSWALRCVVFTVSSLYNCAKCQSIAFLEHLTRDTCPHHKHSSA